MKTLSTPVLLVMAIEFHLMSAQPPSPVAAVTTNIQYVDAKPILETLREDLLPAELRVMTPAERESAWPGWVSRHDSTIRARLERGDEDSVVNFLLFGTTFTKLLRATERDLAQLAAQPNGASGSIIRRRIEDLIAGIESPGVDERLQFARHVIERKSIDPTTAAGKNEIRRYFNESLMSFSAEIAILSARRLNDPSVELLEKITRFRDRGLSSDTSIFADFAIEQALEAIKVEGLLGAGSVRRVAIIGPGLDFTDKHEGYDFYPQQTIQPFAVLDSLLRLGLATADQFRMTTLDLSPRINHHLDVARERARAGGAYALQLPRNMDPPWTPSLVTYWERLGDRIGEGVKAVAVPPSAGSVQVRAIRVRPAVVLSIVPEDLNIVLQRLEPLAAGVNDERFDLIVATNILVYYDVFEQSLALANVAKMLRPGGFFLTNNGVFELPTIPIDWVGQTDVTDIRLPGVGDTGDRLFWYRSR
jgi:hypothetical protein